MAEAGCHSCREIPDFQIKTRYPAKPKFSPHTSLTSVKVAEHTGIISEATSRAGTTPSPHVQGAHTPVLGMGKGAPGGAL